MSSPRTSNHTVVSNAIDQFLHHMEKDSREKLQWLPAYLQWHHSQRTRFPEAELLTNPLAPNLAILYMDPIKHRGGLADRMKGIGHVIQRCEKEQRVLLLKWYDAPMDLEVFLVPTLFNWTLPNHENVSTPENLQCWAELSKDNGQRRIRLIPFPNQFGNYLAPYQHFWSAFFQPSPYVAARISTTKQSLSLASGAYDAVHMRIGHPAFSKKFKVDRASDYDGASFSKDNRLRAILKTSHAFNCSTWLALLQCQYIFIQILKN